jgi:hypothetical protein
MSRPRSEIGGVKQDLLVAVVGFWLIFSVVYSLGRVFVPTFDLPSMASALAGGEAPGEGSEVLPSLRAELLALQHSGVIVRFSGAAEGQALLDQVDSFSVSWPPLAAAEVEDPIRLKIGYRGGNDRLTVLAKDVTLGVITEDGATAILTTEGMTFVAHEGDCTFELTRLEIPSEIPGVPSFSGEITCNDITEVRSAVTVSFVAVFRYDFEFGV